MATAAPAATSAPAAPPSGDAGLPTAPLIRPIPSRKPTHKGLGFAGNLDMAPGVRADAESVDAAGLGDATPAQEGIAPEPQVELGADGLPVEQAAEQTTEPGGDWLSLDLGDGQKATFRDQEHLTQNLKTLRGKFRSMQQNEVSATEKAYGWQQAATRYEAILRTLGVDPETGAFTGGQQGTAQSPSPLPAATSPEQQFTPADLERELSENVDWTVLNNLLRQNPVQAIAYVQMENAKSLSKMLAERLPALIDSRLAPLQEQAERAKGMTQVSQFWSQARAAKDANGTPVFPELQTNDGLEQMGRLWTELHKRGLPLEFLMSPEGIHTTALWLRQYSAQNGGGAQVAPTATPQAVAQQVRAAVDARAGAGNVLSPGARPSTPAPTGRPMDAKKAVAAAIRAAGPSSEFGVRFDD